eukprot:EG_transcript_20449
MPPAISQLARLCRKGRLAPLAAQRPLPGGPALPATDPRRVRGGAARFNVLLARCGAAQDWRALGDVCRAMQRGGVAPDTGTFQALTEAFTQSGVDLVRSPHPPPSSAQSGPLSALIASDGPPAPPRRSAQPAPGRTAAPLTPATFATLLALYPPAATALEALHRQHHRENSIESWEALVTAFGQAADGDAVQRLHNEQWLGLWPSRPESLCTLARAYANAGRPEGVAEVHREAIAAGFLAVERMLRRYAAGEQYGLLATLHAAALNAGLQPRQATAQFISRGLQVAAALPPPP